MHFTAHRQFASASGLEEIKAVHVPVVIRLSPDPAAEIWKYNADGDGINDAAFSSFAEAARALAGLSSLKDLKASIGSSARTGSYFSLTNGQKARAFA